MTNGNPYTDEDVAICETRWDVYLETGAVRTVRKTVKRIDSIGVLRVAFERAAHSLSESTLEERLCWPKMHIRSKTRRSG